MQPREPEANEPTAGGPGGAAGASPPEPTGPGHAAGAGLAPAPSTPAADGGAPLGADGADDEDHRARVERRSRRSLMRQAFGTRLLYAFAGMLGLVTVVVFGVTGVLVRHSVDRALEDELALRLETVARLSARELADPTWLPLARGGSERARSRLADAARALRDEAGVSEIVVFVPPGLGPARAGPDGGEAEAGEPIVLATTRDEGQASRLVGRLLADAVAIDAAVGSGRATTSSLYWDAAGGRQSKGAYAPLRDEAGAVVALVGVELPADFSAAREQVLGRVLMLALLAGLAVLLAAVSLVRRRVHNPIYRLVRAMQGEDGGPPQPAKVRWPDEIGALTEYYNAMVERLTETDRELRRLYDRARETADFLQGYSNYLVAGVPTGVVAVDPRGVVTVWNRSAARILGRDGQRGRPVKDQLGAEHPLARALGQALAGAVTDQALIVLDRLGLGARESGEGDLADLDAGGDEQRLVELTCSPFHGEKGELLGAAALVNDRTELERFRRAASRNERLAAIGNLGAGLAHEIKNPLGAISGFAELIERKAGGAGAASAQGAGAATAAGDVADAARYATRLRGEVEELNRFLSEFLKFARDDVVRREPTDLGELLRRAVEVALRGLLEPTAAERALAGEAVDLPDGGRLTVEVVVPSLPRLALDAPLLRAAFANLVKNGLQAMSGRGGLLSVRAARLDDVLVVRVRDQGPGIPLDLREKVFDPLFTTRAEGTGLGLAIVHKTISAHGGKLAVRDASGGGAELVVRLPFVAAAPAADGGREDALLGAPSLRGG